jgi:hypothetical protein
VPSLLRLHELDTQARQAEGRIVSVDPTRPRRGKVPVTFTFRPEGGPEVTAVRFTRSGRAKEARPGQAIPVVYLPAAPQANCWPFDDGDERKEHRHRADMLWLLCVLWLLSAVVMELSLLRQRFLARRGVLAWAHVLEVGVSRGRRRVRYWCRYEFQDGTGTPVCFCVRVARAFQERHRPGTRVALLYLPGRPRSHQFLAEFWAFDFSTRSPDTPTR